MGIFETIRATDANELLKKIQYRLPYNDNISELINGIVDITRKEIENAPTLDAMPVVRCKCCKLWTGKDYDGCCIKNGLATRMADDFCSYGERRVGE